MTITEEIERTSIQGISTKDTPTARTPTARTATERTATERTATQRMQATLIQLNRPGYLDPVPTIALAPQLSLHAPSYVEQSAIPAQLENQREEGLIHTSRLYLIPKPPGLSDEKYDPSDGPVPSRLSELPSPRETVERYVLGVVEIWGGRRAPMQLARSSHRIVYQRLLALTGDQEVIPKIRKFYLNEPIEGVIEATVTLRFSERVRSLVLRFEGVDRRWLCTELELL